MKEVLTGVTVGYSIVEEEVFASWYAPCEEVVDIRGCDSVVGAEENLPDARSEDRLLICV